jgi:hydroxymethylpyrimidine pyrophosphatase-like HAD family hydrolase
MRYHALACDYDGTAADDGRLAEGTALALRRLRASGRKVVLVTGRLLDDLQSACPDLELFDLVVAENGALLYVPASRETQLLAAPPPPAFAEELRRQGVAGLAVGSVIVATWHPHEQQVLDTIRRMGLEMQVIFNKGAVMVLPSGVNKATGLAAALERLGLSPHNTVAAGDAENDHALLAACECGVAVANALPALKEAADLVTRGDDGNGVAELCARLVETDLEELGAALTRHDLPLGADVTTQEEVLLPAYGSALLVAGTSVSGKSTAVTGLVEQMFDRRYQHVIIDPQGDYSTYQRAFVLGDTHRPPTVDEVRDVLLKPAGNAVVNLFVLPLDQRPQFFAALLPTLRDLRARFGRPHWIVVDEAHQMLPGSVQAAPAPLSNDVSGFVLVTGHPELVTAGTLGAIDVAMVFGQGPGETLAEFAAAAGGPAPPDGLDDVPAGEALVWRRSSHQPPRRIRPTPSRAVVRAAIESPYTAPADA